MAAFKLSDIEGTRAMAAGMVAAINAEAPPVVGVVSEDHQVPSAESGVEVRVRIYRPADASGELPALLWMHAGGWVIGSIEMDDLMCADLAKSNGCAIVSVDYRLAPENPYPAPLDDCYGAWSWLNENAAQLGIDAARIAVGGGSAGGNLAAGLSLRARDQVKINRACNYSFIQLSMIAMFSKSANPRLRTRSGVARMH